MIATQLLPKCYRITISSITYLDQMARVLQTATDPRTHQINGRELRMYDKASVAYDLWGLGCVLYESLDLGPNPRPLPDPGPNPLPLTRPGP